MCVAIITFCDLPHLIKLPLPESVLFNFPHEWVLLLFNRTPRRVGASAEGALLSNQFVFISLVIPRTEKVQERVSLIRTEHWLAATAEKRRWEDERKLETRGDGVDVGSIAALTRLPELSHRMEVRPSCCSLQYGKYNTWSTTREKEKRELYVAKSVMWFVGRRCEKGGLEKNRYELLNESHIVRWCTERDGVTGGEEKLCWCAPLFRWGKRIKKFLEFFIKEIIGALKELSRECFFSYQL